MCTAIFALGLPGPLIFVLAFNRDEFLERPTQPAEFWADAPDVLASRDTESGGTWLGISKAGRIGFLTNCREGAERRPSGTVRSRGSLVSDFLKGAEAPMDYLKGLDLERYQGFNLVVVDLKTGEAAHVNSVTACPVLLQEGVHGMSNGDLNAEAKWPKVKVGKEALKANLKRFSDGQAQPLDVIRSVLSGGEKASCPDPDLPETEYGAATERLLSPIFIDEMHLKGRRYGTRSQTLVTVSLEGLATFYERSLAPNGQWGERSYNLTLPIRDETCPAVPPLACSLASR